jgi:hypothetical protein
MYLSGVLVIWRGNCCCTENTTIEIVFTEGSTVLPPMHKAVERIVRSLAWTIIAGKSAAAVCISYQQRLEL